MQTKSAREIQDHLLKRRYHSSELLRAFGITHTPPLTTVHDTGLDPLTVESYLHQSGHLMAMVMLSTPGWIIADEHAVRQKISAAHRYNVPVVIGKEIFTVAQTKGRLDDFLALSSDLGAAGIEVDYFTFRAGIKPRDFAVIAGKHELQFIVNVAMQDQDNSQVKIIESLVDRGKEWLDAGAAYLVLSAVEKLPVNHSVVSLPALNYRYIDAFARTFGIHSVLFNVSERSTCTRLLDYLGRDVLLGGVKFNELLDVEAYRYGLYPESLRGRTMVNISPEVAAVR